MGAEAKTAVNPEKGIRKGEEPKTQAQAQSWAHNPESGGACGHETQRAAPLRRTLCGNGFEFGDDAIELVD
jgi:hypothetical protein